MKSDLKRIAARTGSVELTDWLRIMPARHRSMPCDGGFGSSRFSSPARAFRVLYAAQDFPTALAEAVIRDRFVGKQRRYIYRPYLEGLVVAELSTFAPLELVDLCGSAAYELGVDTDAKGSRDHQAGQKFAEDLHKRTAADGILFTSRLTGSLCVAVFDRAFPKLTAPPSVDLVKVAALTTELARLNVSVRRRA